MPFCLPIPGLPDLLAFTTGGSGSLRLSQVPSYSHRIRFLGDPSRSRVFGGRDLWELGRDAGKGGLRPHRSQRT